MTAPKPTNVPRYVLIGMNMLAVLVAGFFSIIALGFASDHGVGIERALLNVWPVFLIPLAFLVCAIMLMFRRGRILQALLALPSLLLFPFGTAYGVFALLVCWDEGYWKGPGEAVAEQEPVTALDTRPPEVIAQTLRESGASVSEIRAALAKQQLGADAIETLVYDVIKRT